MTWSGHASACSIVVLRARALLGYALECVFKARPPISSTRPTWSTPLHGAFYQAMKKLIVMASLDATEDDQAVFTALWLSTQQMLDITLDYANTISRSSNWESQQCNFAAHAQPSAAATQQHLELQADADVPLVCSSEHGATAVCPLFIHFNGGHLDCQVSKALPQPLCNAISATRRVLYWHTWMWVT